MTKLEAMQLESECDKLFSDRLGMDCQVSLALTGDIRVSFGGNFVNISKYGLSKVSWFKYSGDYGSFINYIGKIQDVIFENRTKIDLLMKSYGMNFNESEE